MKGGRLEGAIKQAPNRGTLCAGAHSVGEAIKMLIGSCVNRPSVAPAAALVVRSEVAVVMSAVIPAVRSLAGKEGPPQQVCRAVLHC